MLASTKYGFPRGILPGNLYRLVLDTVQRAHLDLTPDETDRIVASLTVNLQRRWETHRTSGPGFEAWVLAEVTHELPRRIVKLRLARLANQSHVAFLEGDGGQSQPLGSGRSVTTQPKPAVNHI